MPIVCSVRRRHSMADARLTRRRLLQALGTAAVTAPFASIVSGQGRCRDGYGTQNCPLTADVATSAIAPVFAPTGWKTVALDRIVFRVADYKKEAAFYTALMGWTLRSDDGKQAVMDIGGWGSVIFKQAEPAAFETNANAGHGRRRFIRLRNRTVGREDRRRRTAEARADARRGQRR